MAQSTAGLALRYFFGDVLIGTAKFPLWWYTEGLAHTAGRCLGSVRNMNRTLGVSLWAKNLFVPMYGETSIEGRLISLFVRFFMLVFRAVGFGAWCALVALFFAAYLALLPLSVLGVLYHAGGMVLF